MKLCLLDHAEVEFLFCLNAITRGLTMLFKNIQVICRVVKKSSQFFAVSDMFCVITLLGPFSFEGTSYFIWQFLSCFLSPYRAFVCCYCRIATKLSCNIWNLTFNTAAHLLWDMHLVRLGGREGQRCLFGFFFFFNFAVVTAFDLCSGDSETCAGQRPKFLV